jgi:hypothetical protein
MRTLRIIEHISLDGVIQYSVDDDDFPYGDWTAPSFELVRTQATPAGVILSTYTVAGSLRR